jgi:hypothetical protein
MTMSSASLCRAGSAEIRSGSAFTSLVERAADYSTVYRGNHTELRQRGMSLNLRSPRRSFG